jgi:hypothetical protein
VAPRVERQVAQIQCSYTRYHMFLPFIIYDVSVHTNSHDCSDVNVRISYYLVINLTPASSNWSICSVQPIYERHVITDWPTDAQSVSLVATPLATASARLHGSIVSHLTLQMNPSNLKFPFRHTVVIPRPDSYQLYS